MAAKKNEANEALKQLAYLASALRADRVRSAKDAHTGLEPSTLR